MIGTIFDIKEMTVHDGDGVRLTVFMKGCPLRCEWCHNPEGLSIKPQLLYKKNKCSNCGLCLQGCEHESCKPYGRCLHICPNDCLSICGEEYSPSSLAKKILKYKQIFNACGGGVTFSGGEPLMQWKFISKTISLISGVNVAVETCGFSSEQVFKDMLDAVDFVYMDIKIFDNKLHKKYTGQDNAVIKNNFRLLKASGKPYVIRTPLIKDITDTENNLNKIKEFIGESIWEKIPENTLAKSKNSWELKP